MRIIYLILLLFICSTAYGAGILGGGTTISGVKISTEGAVSPTDDLLLLDDGTSYLLLDDGTSRIKLSL